MNAKTILTCLWIVSIAYCIYKLYKGYERSSLDGVTGVTSGLDTILIIVLGPVYMIADLVVTLVNRINERRHRKD
jgi:hypothetical protein